MEGYEADAEVCAAEVEGEVGAFFGAGGEVGDPGWVHGDALVVGLEAWGCC